jgi:hypothetical protein
MNIFTYQKFPHSIKGFYWNLSEYEWDESRYILELCRNTLVMSAWWLGDPIVIDKEIETLISLYFVGVKHRISRTPNYDYVIYFDDEETAALLVLVASK